MYYFCSVLVDYYSKKQLDNFNQTKTIRQY